MGGDAVRTPPWYGLPGAATGYRSPACDTDPYDLQGCCRVFHIVDDYM